MAENVELAQPGVEVLQVFQTSSPTVVVPTLMPCILGVCNQVVEVLIADSAGNHTLNTDARVTVPAYVICDDGPYTGANLASKDLLFSVDYGPEFTVTFPAWSGSIAVAVLVSFLNDEFEAANVFQDFYAEAFGDGFILKTRASGDQQLFTIRVPAVGDRTVLAEFGIPEGHTYRGFSTYAQRSVVIPDWAYPDPRGNIDYLSIEYDTVRGFLYLGSGLNLQEGAQNQAFLRWGDRTAGLDCGDIVVVDDGNGDPISPIIAFHVEGLTPAAGENMVATSTVITVTGSQDIDTAGATILGETLTLDAGDGPQTITFIANIATGGGAAFVSLLDTIFPNLDFTLNGSKHLVIATQTKGVDAFLQIVGGTALTALGLVAMAAPVTGDQEMPADSPVSAIQPYPVAVGDLLYVDGVYKGRVLQVAPRGSTSILKGEVKLDTQYPISGTGEHFGTTFYFVAKNLPGAVGADRPTVDMTVDQNNGDVSFKHSLVRDTTGLWHPSMSLRTYLMYTALREDVSVSANRAALLRIDTTTMLDSLLEPVNPTNPLAAGLYLALLNSSGAQVSGLGLDERSDTEPYGTIDAYTRAFEFLESKEVYALAPLTNDLTVGQIANAHASTMGEPANKGERVIVFCLAKPDRAVNTVVASGTCNRSAVDAIVNTGVANLAALLLANGIDASGTILAEMGVYLNIADDANHYSIKSVAGPFVTIRYLSADFAAGSNDDDFYYATGSLPTTPWIDFTFNVSIRGAELLLPNGQPDKDAIADTYQDMGKSFSSRRFWNLVLDKMDVTFDGVSQELEGFYMAAAYAGMIGGQPPQQSFTNFPIIGATKVTGTNDYFSTRQLNRMAYGGNTIIIQDPENTGPIFARMALTTDMTSIETRTDSITKCLDFTAKFLRRSIRVFIGRFNINQSYLDTLSHVIQGLLQFLTGTFVLVDAEINNLVQSETTPDTVTADITCDPPYPCNYVVLRLIV
jgi:hypothetical protein